MFVAVSPTLGVSTLPQLIERAKKEPDKITIAATGIGRLTHLTGELLQARAGIKFETVPYTRGPASAIGDVADGRVSMIIEGYSGIAGAVKAGQVKLIATGAAERLPEFPDLPTVAETLPGFLGLGWQVLVAPVGTPALDRRQGQRRSHQSPQRSGPQTEIRDVRQLSAADDAGSDARFRQSAAGNLGADRKEGRRAERGQVSAAQTQRALGLPLRAANPRGTY